MKTETCPQRTGLEWCFRYGVPFLAWGLVLAFFAFAGSVSTRELVLTSESASSPPAPAAKASSPSAWTPAVDESVADEFARFASNALLATLLDDDQPPRWSDVALRHVCGPGTRVLVDGRPLAHGGGVPATAFTVRWDMDRCNQLEAFDVSGTVELVVFHEDTGLGAIVTPDVLTISSANGTRRLRSPFTSTLSLLQTSRP